MADPMKLHTENFGGNLHQTANMINKRGWAEYVLAMKSSGVNTVVVFRMPRYLVHEIRDENRAYCGDVDHDDPVTPEEDEMSCLM